MQNFTPSPQSWLSRVAQAPNTTSHDMAKKMLFLLHEYTSDHPIQTEHVEHDDWTAMIEYAETWCRNHGEWDTRFRVAFRRSLLENTLRGPIEDVKFREVLDNFLVQHKQLIQTAPFGASVRYVVDDEDWEYLVRRMQEVYVSTG